MKKIVVMLSVMCFGLMSAMAQEPATSIAEQYALESIDREAQFNVDFLDGFLELSDEQKQEVYNLHVEWLNAKANAKTDEERLKVEIGLYEGLKKVFTKKQWRKYTNNGKALVRDNKFIEESDWLTSGERKRSSRSVAKQMKERLGLSEQQRQQVYDLDLKMLNEMMPYDAGAIVDTKEQIRIEEEYVAGLKKILTPEQWAKNSVPIPPVQRTPKEIARENKKNEKVLKDLQKKLDKAAQKQQKQLDKAAKKQ